MQCLATRVLNLALLGIAVLLIVACISKSVPQAVTQSHLASCLANVADQQEPATMAGEADFATVIERRKPIGVVAGGLRPLLTEARPDTEKFTQAITYAEKTQSYALLIWKDGSLQVEHYFEPYAMDLRAESASMHKSVVGILTAAAIADGDIESVDDRSGNYIEAWGNDPRGDITIRNLLTMSSGLQPLSFEGGAEAEARRYIFDGEAARAATLAMRMSEHAPGETFQYLEAATQLLVLILEAATGKPYADYLSDRLWRPLGADDAYVWFNEVDGFPRGYTGLLARPRDWLRLGLLVKDSGLYDGRQILPSRLMDQAVASSNANPNYGWHLWLGSEYQPDRYYNDLKTGFSVSASAPFATDDLIYFDGFGGQRVYISRKEDLVIVRKGALRMDWDDACLPNLVLAASR